LLKNKLIFLVLILSCLFLMCSGNKESENSVENEITAYWPIFRGDQNLSGVSGEQLPDKLELLWSFNTENEIYSSPVIGFGKVYIGSLEGKIYSINLLTGTKVWEFNTDDDIEASPLLLDQTIYIGNLSGTFFALHALSGRIKWKHETGSNIMGSANWVVDPKSSKKLVLVGSYDTKMYCFDTETGELKWTYETDDYINGAPATDGQNIVFGGCDQKLHILSVNDGTKIGHVRAGSYIAGSAALVDNHAFLGHYGSKLVCINLAEQKIVWEYEDKESRGEYFSSPAVGKDRVIIGSRDYFLHCVDRETGKNIWKFQTRDEVDSSPVIVNDKVVFGSADGRLYILNLEDGKEIWSYEIGAAILGCPAVTGGMIVVGAEDGRVYTFGERR
jgi:outer membrane protein assembly factor BamB